MTPDELLSLVILPEDNETHIENLTTLCNYLLDSLQTAQAENERLKIENEEFRKSK